MHLFHVGRHVFVVEGFDVDVPLVSVAVLLTLLAKRSGNVPVDDGLDDGQSLKYMERQMN